MKGKMFEKVDIDSLIYAVGIIGDQPIINPTDTHWRSKRNYKCLHCDDFKLHFEKVNEETDVNKAHYVFCNRDVMKHHSQCCITKNLLTKGRHIIEESQFLIDLLKRQIMALKEKRTTNAKCFLALLAFMSFIYR